ncbi:hypothetical protein GUJ93_ZPchr0002g25937 [Zizania palustris]|uniref:Uncharacterized protein n=1 Tax=Zizania palustris TaxID=103762 RepID=A0A8J5S6N1_ZIZPA|nr:hypothetical protein GUJ93_ZPchr0002g25937 [Zizania palustris]
MEGWRYRSSGRRSKKDDGTKGGEVVASRTQIWRGGHRIWWTSSTMGRWRSRSSGHRSREGGDAPTSRWGGQRSKVSSGGLRSRERVVGREKLRNR